MATTSTTPTRFDAQLFAAAQQAGSRAHRSAAQQLAHWATLGMELEASAGLSVRDIDRVLAGQASYDDLAVREQAAVRATWREETAEKVAKLDLRSKFAAEGRTRASYAGPDGAVVTEDLEQADEDAKHRTR